MKLRPGSVLDFMRLLWAVDHGLQSMSKRMDATIGVTGPQRLVIRMVGVSPGIAAGELSGVLHLHPSTLTGILRRLEDEHLVERQPDPRDGRRSLIHLTPAGRRLDATRAGTVEWLLDRVLARQPPARLAATRAVLAAMAAELDRVAGSSGVRPA